jgi:serine/threonine-protein kinase
MRSIPLVAMLAAAVGLAALAVVVLAVVIVVVRRPASPEAKGPGAAAPADLKDTAPEVDLREARSKGVAALEALAAQYPKDGKIVRALIVALVAEKRKLDAMQAMTTLVARDPSAAEDEALLKAVRACAEDEGADDLAFELMEGPLGARGTELLYDLGSSKVSARAAKSLAKPEIRERSRAVAVALDLKAASSCDAKKALLPRLRDDGDKRSLPGLKALKSTSGCGFLRRGDCWPCMRQGSDLATAIREIEARSETPAPASSDK